LTGTRCGPEIELAAATKHFPNSKPHAPGHIAKADLFQTSTQNVQSANLAYNLILQSKRPNFWCFPAALIITITHCDAKGEGVDWKNRKETRQNKTSTKKPGKNVSIPLDKAEAKRG